MSRRPVPSLETIQLAASDRVRRERQAARRALAGALNAEYEIARRFADDPHSLSHDDIDRAIDARLNAEARLGEWSR